MRDAGRRAPTGTSAPLATRSTAKLRVYGGVCQCETIQDRVAGERHQLSDRSAGSVSSARGPSLSSFQSGGATWLGAGGMSGWGTLEQFATMASATRFSLAQGGVGSRFILSGRRQTAARRAEWRD